MNPEGKQRGGVTQRQPAPKGVMRLVAGRRQVVLDLSDCLREDAGGIECERPESSRII